MNWLIWVMLPLPLLSLATLAFALTRRDAEPKQRRTMIAVSCVALALGVLLMVLVAGR